ncbi:Acetoacetate metabolism regulatory protein AtoC [Desulfosarcina cetonica]|nr:Acetoacetate metabolism regulatory protein AtoC [Desulfosarcina cetonica]
MLKVLIVDDEAYIRETLEMILIEKEYDVITAKDGKSGIETFQNEKPDIVILDIRLPDINGLDVLKQMKKLNRNINVIMITAYHDMETTIQAMRYQAQEYIHKPIDANELDFAVDKVAENVRACKSSKSIISPRTASYTRDKIVGKSNAIKEIFKKIGLVSENKATVLIQGESGTGKELIAKAIHYHSVYHSEPFVPINCSALVELLIESELFGHEKGAFTGAINRKIGKIEQAGSGTILLDEIGEISPAIQVKLLRFLQEREFERVGGAERIASNVRVISATNRDLSKLVEENRFRKDLYYRLKVVEINVPPLRDRKEDIPLLVEHLICKINAEYHKNVTRISQKAMEAIFNYNWPGNIRELENMLTRAVVHSTGTVLQPDSFPDLFYPQGETEDREKIMTLMQLEKEHVIKALQQTNWNRGITCDLLGISRPTLREKIKKYKLNQ